jgi:hypothetical protein
VGGSNGVVCRGRAYGAGVLGISSGGFIGLLFSGMGTLLGGGREGVGGENRRVLSGCCRLSV